MRMVKIPGCSYELFEKIRDVILDHVPFALINDIYHKKRETAYFYFWDSDYIPFQLQPFIVQPPADREPMDEQMKSLEKALGWDPKKEPEAITADYMTIPYTETQEELETYLKDLPEELAEQLREKWKERQKEEKE